MMERRFQSQKRSQDNAITFATLIDLISATAELDCLVAAWNDMLARGSEPDRLMYGMFMTCLSEAGRPEEAARLHEEMMGKGISPDTVSFTILINAFGKANQPHRAWQAFERMEAAKNPSNDGQEYDVKRALELMKTGLGTTVPRHGCGTLNHRETIGYRKGGVLT